MEKSQFMRETFGETLFENFLIEKHKEWDQYKKIEKEKGDGKDIH
jgi:glutamine synthetase